VIIPRLPGRQHSRDVHREEESLQDDHTAVYMHDIVSKGIRWSKQLEWFKISYVPSSSLLSASLLTALPISQVGAGVITAPPDTCQDTLWSFKLKAPPNPVFERFLCYHPPTRRSESLLADLDHIAEAPRSAAAAKYLRSCRKNSRR